MSQNLIAIAALVSSLVNLGMLLIHCRRDRREFRNLEKAGEQ